jgi:hypothetical protein
MAKAKQNDVISEEIRAVLKRNANKNGAVITRRRGGFQKVANYCDDGARVRPPKVPTQDVSLIRRHAALSNKDMVAVSVSPMSMAARSVPIIDGSTRCPGRA